MVFGEGVRKIGEACWSHAQCWRSQHNAHCHALVCTCDSGFHNHSGKCSRSVWEDLGLAPWELILVSLLFTLIAFAIFVGCVYFIISKLIRLRKTSPAESVSPEASFEEDPGKESLKKKSMKKANPPVVPSKNTKIFETKLMIDKTVESHLVDDEVMLSNDEASTTSTLIFEPPVRFITPLDYRSSDSGYSDTRQSSRRSSSSGHRTLHQFPFGSHNPPRFTRGWSTATGTSHEDSDDWFQPNRNHHRRLGPNSPAGTTRLPLLLRSSTFSESDESP